MELQNSQNSIEICKFELSYNRTVTDAWDLPVSRTGLSVTQNRGGARDGVAAVKLADGDFTGDEEGISVTTSTSRID